MKEFVLNYYPLFKCIAQDCKHTCCAGWQVYIDEQTLQGYKKETSPFSSELKKAINFKKGRFRTDGKGRCALLDERGLCKIIKNLGEQNLCQVCRDHPRFRSFFSGITETGLGFCCQEATRIILSFPEKIAPVLVFSDGKEEKLGFLEEKVIEFRERALAIVQNREENISRRIYALLSLCNATVTKSDGKRIAKFFFSLSRLDKAWTKMLKTVDGKSLIGDTDERYALTCEQFLVNCIYRYASGADDTASVRARTLACVFAWWIVKAVACSNGDIVESARAFSAEVEYNQKNLARLFSFCEKFIKIGE